MLEEGRLGRDIILCSLEGIVSGVINVGNNGCIVYIRGALLVEDNSIYLNRLGSAILMSNQTHTSSPLRLNRALG